MLGTCVNVTARPNDTEMSSEKDAVTGLSTKDALKQLHKDIEDLLQDFKNVQDKRCVDLSSQSFSLFGRLWLCFQPLMISKVFSSMTFCDFKCFSIF